MTCNKREKKDSAIFFFKIITTSSLEAGKLRIPNSFTRKYCGNMSNPVFFKLPDNTSWEIHWSKHDSDIWFQKGWKEFTSYYSLDHGHLLLFEYNNTSHFRVHIFDKSTFEIEYPSQGNQDEKNNPDDQIRDDSVEILDEIPPSKRTKRKSPMSFPQPHKKLRSSTSVDVRRNPKLQNMPKQVKNEGNDTLDTNFESSTFFHKKLEDGAGGTTEQEELTSKITEALNREKDTSFMVVMKSSGADGYSLSIPSHFANQHLKKKSDILLEVLDGRTWSVSYNLLKFNSGWKNFASDNNLKVGNVCIFELTKKKPLSLKVLIFPLAEGQSEGVTREISRRTSKLTRHQHLKNAALEEARRTSMLTSHQHLKNAALEEANKFNSKNPFFIVNLTPDTKQDYRPRVPNPFIRKYFNDQQQTIMLQYEKELWPVNLIYCRGQGSGKLSKGWIRFARESKCVVGDVCVFELINKEDLVLQVRIYRGH